MKPGRNAPCPCGSGKKYKNCCMGKVILPPLTPTIEELNQLIGIFNAGRLTEVESQARLLVERYPNSGITWKILGATLHRLGKEEALPALRKATKLLPNDAEAHYNLGVTLKGLGDLNGAVASYRRALELDPKSADVYNNLGDVLTELGQLDDALASCRYALEINPNYAEAWNNLGNVLQHLGNFEDAATNYRHALQIQPNFAMAHNNLGTSLQNVGLFSEAVASCRRALEIKPDYAEAFDNLGSALQNLGQLDDAVSSYRRALEIKPDFVGAYSNLLFCLNHSETVNPQTLLAEHRRFADQFEVPLRADWPQHINSPDPLCCIQIGFVSGDFRNHSVAHFIEPVLEYLAQYPQLSLHAYYNHAIEDSVTQRLRGYMAHWHSTVGLTDEALAQTIRQDGIDILIDLSGHTAKHRLLTFARKPAPIQASWMGYPGTTGLSAMDYYFADHFLLPIAQFADQFTEKIMHLPANAPFLPSKDAPPVNALPAVSNGFITFGSFNRPSKIGRPVVALWSQLLRSLPTSRLLLGAMAKDKKYDRLIEWFSQEGIARDRLSFRVRSIMSDYLGQHQEVDICLDTFPYNGGTTTCHALWMGVPTLTLAGKIVPGRQGAAVMGHVGLDTCVAHDAADFVQKGMSLAGNLAALSDFRKGARERFAKSAMGQPELIAAGLERGLRIMWQRWCAKLPCESFAVSSQATNSMMHEVDTEYKRLEHDRI